MEDITIHVLAKKVFSESTEYLPIIERSFFATKKEISEADDLRVQYNVQDGWGLDGELIPIVELKKLIDKAEKAGANLISVNYSHDHNEYDIVGYNVTRMGKKEVKQLEKLEEIEMEKRRLDKIKELEERIQNLKNP